MAIVEVKENVRLRLEFDAGMDGDKQLIKSKIYTRIKPEATSEILYNVANGLGGLQELPLYQVKRLEEILLREEL